ncbi:hypothetical protein [Thermobispora bispora]|uniref:hypothetical protein n=1 Tax=Thermobispora bispora TaxID=2006 RepID=UPI001F11DBCF|nr:hypothetical protein [Thermobispora bispora]
MSADVHPALIVGAGVAAALLAGLVVWLITRAVRARPIEDSLTIVAASIATAVSAQGMWRFFGDVLGFDGPLRILLFAFIEVAVVTSAVRARRSMRENYSAGIDGIAVWVLTGLSAVLASMDARTLPEAIFRLAAPLVAAWLWERGMAIERRRVTGRQRIYWRFTLERLLVRIGLAETTDRTAAEVDMQRRLTKVALAAKRVRDLYEAGASRWRMGWAMRALHRAFMRASRHTDVTQNSARQQHLAGMVAALVSVDRLPHVPAASAWAPGTAGTGTALGTGAVLALPGTSTGGDATGAGAGAAGTGTGTAGERTGTGTAGERTGTGTAGERTGTGTAGERTGTGTGTAGTGTAKALGTGTAGERTGTGTGTAGERTGTGTGTAGTGTGTAGTGTAGERTGTGTAGERTGTGTGTAGTGTAEDAGTAPAGTKAGTIGKTPGTGTGEVISIDDMKEADRDFIQGWLAEHPGEVPTMDQLRAHMGSTRASRIRRYIKAIVKDQLAGKELVGASVEQG